MSAQVVELPRRPRTAWCTSCQAVKRIRSSERSTTGAQATPPGVAKLGLLDCGHRKNYVGVA